MSLFINPQEQQEHNLEASENNNSEVHSTFHNLASLKRSLWAASCYVQICRKIVLWIIDSRSDELFAYNLALCKD